MSFKVTLSLMLCNAVEMLSEDLQFRTTINNNHFPLCKHNASDRGHGDDEDVGEPSLTNLRKKFVSEGCNFKKL